MTTKDIRTSNVQVTCDVCGRTLLRGEHSETYLAGGSRRQVCELCTARAVHEGWVREGAALERRARSFGGERRRSLLGRLWRSGEGSPRERSTAADAEPNGAHDGWHEPPEEREPLRPAPAEPRQVHAVP